MFQLKNLGLLDCKMSPENCKIIREAILEAAEVLQNHLPDHPKHPKGKNPYAHIPKVIKNISGHSYEDLPDEYIQDVLDIIEYCKEYPF